MSELRDLADALSAIGKSLSSIEEHVAREVANGEQLRVGMHELRNSVQNLVLARAGTERAIAQIQVWMGDFATKLGTLTAQQELQQNGLLRGLREARQRLDELESKDETTQP